MLLPKIREYMLHGLSATPIVMSQLISTAQSVDYDFRPYPDRFTLREVLGHLADWEDIFFTRISRMVKEENPVLPNMDEGQIAIDHDYSHMDPEEQLARFQSGRARLTTYLKYLSEDEWIRPGLRPELGSMTVESMCVMIVGHDGYHTKQCVEWLELIAQA